METKKVRITLADERELDFETRSFACPADRIELERRFNISTSSLGSPESREEWVVFLLYRVVVRAAPEFADVSFDAFIEQLGAYEFVDSVQTVDPTVEEAPTG